MKKISYNPYETLDSFGLTAKEFYDKLQVGKKCSGIREAFPDFTSKNCSEIPYCTHCPLSNKQDELTLLDWLSRSK